MNGLLHLLEAVRGNHQLRGSNLIFAPFFIPENKAIDDLLQELRTKHAHIAIVVDEFGGTSGMVTLEDVLEEVFGELNDEFDEQTLDYIKVNNFTYIYEGKTLIVDFLRETGLSVSLFDSLDIESDTLAGLITEHNGLIPKKDEIIVIENVKFIVEAADPRKVKKIRVILPK
jgi:CBS domain containing-hemolysin-like protein